MRELEAALEELINLIDQGYEYPDAHWLVTSRRNVSSDELALAYDEHCLLEERRRRNAGASMGERIFNVDTGPCSDD
jgi:hypothetical protein